METRKQLIAATIAFAKNAKPEITDGQIKLANSCLLFRLTNDQLTAIDEIINA